jgi:hypothetical protein
MFGVLLSVVLVDRAVRRPLLVWGSIGCRLSMLVIAGGDAMVAMCLFVNQCLTQDGRADLCIVTDCRLFVCQMFGVLLSVVLVDRAGRRPLLVWGSIGCCLSMVVIAGGDALRSAPLVLAGMAFFMLAFSCSHAGVFWVVCSEIFSMSAKSPAASAATAMLFLVGASPNAVICLNEPMVVDVTLFLFMSLRFPPGLPRVGCVWKHCHALPRRCVHSCSGMRSW